ncbi:MAG: hypothetical protein EA411_03365 [Saprospirales bacterium]|nr:MAG: hypothetical protein EA411_03365 [Saprospirales bacterium]
MTLKNNILLIGAITMIAMIVSCDMCDESEDPCYFEANRKNLTESGTLELPSARVSVWTPDADKNCHAVMSLTIIYPKILRVYKTGNEEITTLDSHMDITDYIQYEFGVPFGYFPSHHRVEEKHISGPHESLVLTSRVDQAAKNFPYDDTQYRVEFNIAESFQESDLYQRFLDYNLTQNQFNEKFNSLPDMDEPDLDLEDEESYFKIYKPGEYVISINYTIPLHEEE